MPHPYIGLDIGTTATKAVAFHPDGQVWYQTSREYAMYHPQPGWSVQRPADILQAVQECITALEQEFGQLAFISFSSAMHSLMLIDERGLPLTECLLWADNRAAAAAEQLRNSPLGRELYLKTGIPIHTFSPLTKLLWFKQHEPALYQRAAKLISAKEYVWHHLTGAYQIDSSMASGTGMMNLYSLQWEPEVLELLEIKPQQLSTIVAPTHSFHHLEGGPTYVIGAGDGPLASLGTGAMAPNKMALTIGTSGAIRFPVKGPLLDAEMRTQCYHLQGEDYLSLGAVNNGAVVLQWLREKVLQTSLSFEALFEQAAKVPAGAEGLLFVPYLLGERAPIWDASAQGCLIGLSIEHRQEHLVRAALEGIVLGLRHIADYLLPISADRTQIEIRASGGFARSALWVQIVADVFQMRVALVQTVEGSAWGAVQLGCKALDLPYTADTGQEIVFYPNPVHAEIYQAALRKFKQVYPFLKTLN